MYFIYAGILSLPSFASQIPFQLTLPGIFTNPHPVSRQGKSFPLLNYHYSAYI